MSHSQTVLDPNPELINMRSLNFAKPKLFFKNIGHYTATYLYIHSHLDSVLLQPDSGHTTNH
jgi:hypothetical protein